MRPFAARWALLGTAPSLVAGGYLYLVLDDVEPGLRLALALGVTAAAYLVMTPTCWPPRSRASWPASRG